MPGAILGVSIMSLIRTCQDFCHILDALSTNTDHFTFQMFERLGNQGKFALCGIGIFVCYFYYGILQERITRGKYGEGEAEERFTCIMALVAFQCAVNYLYALIMGHTVLKQGEDTTKSSFYACASLTYLLAMVTSNKALSWVNYPTQVKSWFCCRHRNLFCLLALR